jgi:hypothetical protein
MANYEISPAKRDGNMEMTLGVIYCLLKPDKAKVPE